MAAKRQSAAVRQKEAESMAAKRQAETVTTTLLEHAPDVVLSSLPLLK